LKSVEDGQDGKDPNARRRPVEGGGRYFSELAEGLRFLRSKTLLFSMVLVATVGNFDQPLLTVIAPVYGKEIYGSPASFGALVGSFGAGAFAGSLLFGSVFRTWPRRRVFLICFLDRCRPHLRNPRALAAAGCRNRRCDHCGIRVRAVNPIFATVTQENTPPHLLERVFGALTAIAQAAIPIGAVVAASRRSERG
jgi:MFS family permease